MHRNYFVNLYGQKLRYIFFFLLIIAAKVAKASAKNVENVKEKATNTVHSSISFADPSKFIDEILDKTSALVISEVTTILFSSIPNVFKNYTF